MTRFTNILSRIRDRLDLPQPTKSRILLEIASDLEDAYHYYVDRGMTDQEATKKSLAIFDIDDASLSELVRIHQTPIQRWLDGLSAHAQTLWERILLILVLLTVIVISIPAVTATSFLNEASGFVWPVLGIGLAALIVGADKAITLYVIKDHRHERLRQRLLWLPVLVGASIFTGIFGYFLEIAKSEHLKILTDFKMIIMLNTTKPEMSALLTQTTEWLIRSSSMIVTSMFVAMGIAIIWFLLENKVKRIEIAEATTMLVGRAEHKNLP